MKWLVQYGNRNRWITITKYDAYSKAITAAGLLQAFAPNGRFRVRCAI